ncbi:hypothetical protein CYMTET_11239 [Cymbomonas tetramitiformis]|uniref:Uncharacterized protein n=1 Tax=Cymbomonas tetramitiformis TaxID=36881 RepID=A0AAE0GMV7_9CHLO|nr:hypothetical protein CYMTET_11239 [Cymbomonas tetramitiformis]
MSRAKGLDRIPQLLLVQRLYQHCDAVVPLWCGDLFEGPSCGEAPWPTWGEAFGVSPAQLGPFFITFGGYQHQNYYGMSKELHVFDFDDKVWLQPTQSGVVPQSRGYAAVSTTSSGVLYLFGGAQASGDHVTDERVLYRLEGKTFTWSKVEVSNPEEGPGGFLASYLQLLAEYYPSQSAPSTPIHYSGIPLTGNLYAIGDMVVTVSATALTSDAVSDVASLFPWTTTLRSQWLSSLHFRCGARQCGCPMA